MRVSVREDEGAVAVAVTDNGNGFNPAEANTAGTAFRRFERAGVTPEPGWAWRSSWRWRGA